MQFVHDRPSNIGTFYFTTATTPPSCCVHMNKQEQHLGTSARWFSSEHCMPFLLAHPLCITALSMQEDSCFVHAGTTNWIDTSEVHLSFVYQAAEMQPRQGCSQLYPDNIYIGKQKYNAHLRSYPLIWSSLLSPWEVFTNETTGKHTLFAWGWGIHPVIHVLNGCNVLKGWTDDHGSSADCCGEGQSYDVAVKCCVVAFPLLKSKLYLSYPYLFWFHGRQGCTVSFSSLFF